MPTLRTDAASANNLGGSATEEAPATLVATHVTPLKRKSSLPQRRTANSLLWMKTPSFQPVTKENMTTVNQSAELQPVTLAPPSGQPKNGSSFSLQPSGYFSDLDDTSEDDGKPRTHTKPSKCKTRWSASQAHSQIKSSLMMLKGRKKAVPFRALRLPDSINWLEPELIKGKAFEDAKLRANAAGMCGLSALTCVETSRAHATIIHTMFKTLPPMANASQEELKALRAWRDDIRHEVAD
jgi:hypothetical protein